MNTPKTIEVNSHTDSTIKYMIDIDNKTCTCNSYQYTKNIPKSCKHLDDYITNTKSKVSKEILQQNTDMDLINTVKSGQIDKIRALIAAGASIDVKDNLGRTALQWASYAGHIDCVNALIAAGASIDLKDNSGWTALMCASDTGKIDCVNALIAAGANIYDILEKYANDKKISTKDAKIELQNIAKPWHQKQLNGFTQGVSESVNRNTLLLQLNYDNSPLRIIMKFL